MKNFPRPKTSKVPSNPKTIGELATRKRMEHAYRNTFTWFQKLRIAFWKTHRAHFMLDLVNNGFAPLDAYKTAAVAKFQFKK